MAEKKISKRNVLTAVMGYFQGQDYEDVIVTTDEYDVTVSDIIDYAANEIRLIDSRNEKSAERRAKAAAENDSLKEQVLACVIEEPQTREMITNAVIAATGNTDLTVGKVGSRLSKLVEEGVIVKDMHKFGDRKVTGYSLPAATEE